MFQVYEKERKMNTPEKFLFPAFERINWYAGERLVQELHDCRSSNSPKYMTTLLTGAKALVGALKLWNIHRCAEEIPATVNSHKLLKDLSKEIRYTERYYNQLWPPKPERESKRQKKKPVDKDFVDFSALKEEQMRLSPKSSRKDSTSGLIHPPLKILLPKDKFESTLAGTLASVSSSLCKTESTDSQDSSDSSSSRLRLKLTLPKPSLYPYSSVPSPGSLNSPMSSSPASLQESASSPMVMTLKMPSQSNTSPHHISQHNAKWSKQSSKGIKVEATKNLHLHSGHQVIVENPSTPSSLHRGGTILRFKFGPKEASVENKQILSTDNDVYDFHDSDEDNRLLIDEKPNSKKGKNQFNVNIHDMNPEVFGGDMEVAGEVDVVSDAPKNGIEELLKASCYTLESSEDMESGRASQSTREAIAGMLSLGSSAFCNQESLSNRPQQHRPKVHLPVRNQIQQLAEDLGEPIDKVHQDEDYIYPSLDHSDDEDGYKPRGKRPMDEAWNPKARVGPVGPKVNRPAREGAKKQSVEKGLEAAAAKRAALPPPKRPYNRKVQKVSLEASQSKVETPPSVVTPSTSAPVTPVQQPSQPSPSPTKSSPSDSTQKRVKMRAHKKGMATAKQRLGKILKIHKMIY